MKKAFSAVIFILFVLPLTAFAGDLPEAIISMLDVDVFIGEIVEMEGGAVKIDVDSSLFDCYDVDTITVGAFEYMGGDDRRAYIGDYVVIGAEYVDKEWKIVFESEQFSGFVARCDSLDAETVHIYGAEEGGMLERMNGYINDGTYSYESRKEITGQEASAPLEAMPESGQNVQSSQIANETIIVLPPPAIENVSNSESILDVIGYWYDKPYIKYTFITLLSAFVSFFFTKRVACKIEGRER